MSKINFVLSFRGYLIKLMVIFLASLASNIRAQDKILCVIVYENNRISTFDIGKRPRVSFFNNDVLLECADISALFQLENYLKMTIEEVDSSMRINRDIVPFCTFRIRDNVITATGYGRLSIYDIAGRECYCAIPDAYGTVSFSISNYPAGIYVVVSNNRSFKIRKQ